MSFITTKKSKEQKSALRKINHMQGVKLFSDAGEPLFIKLYYIVLKDVGCMSAAAVFGRMMAFAQMTERWVCEASAKTIARELGLSDRTVYTAFQTLESVGYIKDLTPDWKDKPHMYKVKYHFEITKVENVESPDDLEVTLREAEEQIDDMGLTVEEMMGA